MCLVPENRKEIRHTGRVASMCLLTKLHCSTTTTRLKDAGIRVSFFVDPVRDNMYASAGLQCMTWWNYTRYVHQCHRRTERQGEVARLVEAARHSRMIYGLQVNAGHGLTTTNVRDPAFAVPHLAELNIGHHLVSRAITIGLRTSISEMLCQR